MHSKKRYLKQPFRAFLIEKASVCAEVAELVDALGSGSSPGIRVGVRVSPSAPKFMYIYSNSPHKLTKIYTLTAYIPKKAI